MRCVGYERWAKVYNVKAVAKALLFLEQHDIRDIDELRKRADDSSEYFSNLSKTIKSAEKRMAEIAVLKTHILNYSKTKDVYVAYRKAGYSKAFFEAHREEITLHKAAKEAFSELDGEKIPTVKQLNEEYAELLQKKKRKITISHYDEGGICRNYISVRCPSFFISGKRCCYILHLAPHSGA